MAILYANLNGQLSYPIVDVLKARGIPFAFTTGYGSYGIDKKYRDTPVIAKPFANERLEQLIKETIAHHTRVEDC